MAGSGGIVLVSFEKMYRTNNFREFSAKIRKCEVDIADEGENGNN